MQLHVAKCKYSMLQMRLASSNASIVNLYKTGWLELEIHIKKSTDCYKQGIFIFED